MFSVLEIIGNRVIVRYYDIEFPLYIDGIAPRLYVSKPKSIYFHPEAYKELVKVVFMAYREQVQNNESAS